MADCFLKIFNISVTASYLVAAVLLLRLILKKAPKWTNCILWFFVAIRLILPFSIESEISLVPSAQVITINEMSEAPITVDSGIDSIDGKINDAIIAQMQSDSNQHNNNSKNELKEPNKEYTFISVAAYIWLAGVLAMMSYGIVSYFSLKRKVKVCVPFGDYCNVYYCDNIETSFVLGIVKPQIYIASSTPGESIGYVLSHERAHIKRKDHLLKALAFILLCVHWFNPIMWIAYIMLCRDIEIACDEHVIQDENITEITGYVTALLQCGAKRKMINACPVAFGEVGIKSRVKLILKHKKPTFWIVFIAAIISAAVVLGFFTNPKSEAKSDSAVSDFQSEIDMSVEGEKTEIADVKNQKTESICEDNENFINTSGVDTTHENVTSGDNITLKPTDKPNKNDMVSSKVESTDKADSSSSGSIKNESSSEIVDNNESNTDDSKLDNQTTVKVSDYEVDGTVVDWIVEDDFVYMIFQKPNRYIVVDTNKSLVIIDKPLVGYASEMHIFGNDIWLSYRDLKCIKIYDKNTFTLKSTKHFDYEITSFDIYNDYLIFSAGNSIEKVYRYNLKTDDIAEFPAYTGYYFHKPDILVNQKHGLVYMSETGNTGCRAYCYDIESLTLKSKYIKDDYGYFNHKRRSYLIGECLYWGEFGLNATNISRLETQYSNGSSGGILFANDRYVVMLSGIYLRDTCEQIVDATYFGAAAITKSGNVLVVDSTDMSIYYVK